ncbi:MAG: hypothetical protein ACI8UC_001098 [Psychromonas sp.]
MTQIGLILTSKADHLFDALGITIFDKETEQTFDQLLRLKRAQMITIILLHVNNSYYT